MKQCTKEVVVSNNETSSRYDAQVGGHTAFIEYRRSPEVCAITDTMWVIRPEMFQTNNRTKDR
jgi:hypothetical protein